MPKLPTRKYCTGCLSCVDACHHQAITTIIKNGHTYVEVDASKCVDCGLCENACPIISPYNTNKREYMQVYGGWCNNNTIRQQSASGGAFSGLAMTVLENNGIVFGAALIDNSVKHIAISHTEELSKLQNSKYIQSDTSKIYQYVKEALKTDRPILFSGTPCQIAALNSFLHKKYSNLLTVDLICNGVPSKEAIDLFFAERKPKDIISYRNKECGWSSLKSQSIIWKNMQDQIIREEHELDTFYQIFSAGITSRKVCCHCPFSSVPRQADITIGDFWGINRFKEEWRNGISVIIANNTKGAECIKGCKHLTLFKSSLEECIYANPRLINGKKYHEYHPIMMFPSLKRILPKYLYYNILKNKMPYKLGWAPFKILTIISNKLAIKSALKYEKNRNHNNL